MVRRRWRHLPEPIRRDIIRLAAGGMRHTEIAQQLDLALATVDKYLHPYGGVIRADHWHVSDKRLSLEERFEIKLGLQLGWTLRHIGNHIGRSPSTVCREVNANGGRDGYHPSSAHRRACTLARRPKPTKLQMHPELLDRIVHDLERTWSPRQICQRMRTEFGEHPVMNISHETIYRSLFVQGRGELRRELAACLRSGRAVRRARGRVETRGRIKDMVMISERPAEIEDRAVPGHWEGDLIMGKDNKSAIGTLVERSTRFVLLLHLRGDRTAANVRAQMTKKIATLPNAMRRSITWDQGVEMAEHARFTVDTGVQIYFCDPRSPWQRGSNENTNGLLRQFFPKGTDLSRHGPKRLAEVEDLMNGRPRETLNWRTPAEKFAEFVATTG